MIQFLFLIKKNYFWTNVKFKKIKMDHRFIAFKKLKKKLKFINFLFSVL
jgi:predicted RNA-binding protein